MITTCPKCNSKNLSSRIYSINSANQSKSDITDLKPKSDLLAYLILIMVVIPSFLAMLWFFSLGSLYGGLLCIALGLPFAIFSANTINVNKMLREQKRATEHTCLYCKSVFDDNGNFLSMPETENNEIASAVTPSLPEPSEKIAEVQVSDETAPIVSETSKIDEAKLCSRCYMESSTFFICKECGYVNKAIGGGLFFIAVIGLAIGIHGLLAWTAGVNNLWVEVLKTLLCGFPGAVFAYWGISEFIYITKSRQWSERHNHDMTELLNFYKRSPNATIDEAGKFLNHTGQWVKLMLNESKSKIE